MPGQTGIEVEFVQELQFLISAVIILLEFDHFLKLFLDLYSDSDPSLIDLLLFDLIFRHLCSLDECLHVNDFAGVTLQGLEYVPEVLTLHQVSFHHVQKC